MPRYLEDLHAGQTYVSPQHALTDEQIVAFAREFDPQPFHTDPDAAKASFFGGLVASGWHTAALTMRLMTESGMDLAGGIIGAGVEGLRWPSPLRAGEAVAVRVTILAVRPSQSRPAIGIVTFKVETVRSDGTAVQEMTGSLIVPRRSST
jgi:acyl dehydratase